MAKDTDGIAGLITEHEPGRMISNDQTLTIIKEFEDRATDDLQKLHGMRLPSSPLLLGDFEGIFDSRRVEPSQGHIGVFSRAMRRLLFCFHGIGHLPLPTNERKD